MRSRPRSTSRPGSSGANRPVELVRVRGAQRDAGAARGEVKNRGRRGGRGRGKPNGHNPQSPRPRTQSSFWSWLKRLFQPPPQAKRKLPPGATPSESEARIFAEFAKQYDIAFQRPDLLKLALTHRSYLSVTGQGARESNERLEFLGDSVLGLVTSEFLYREHPTEHEGQLTKTKSLLVSKAILSRRALAMGLGKYVLMSRSESDSGGRQRLSILADAFESVIGAIYLDQGFEASRHFIMRWLLRDSREIASDKRHTNYKSHLQEFVQSTYRTHPVYRIRSEAGPDHSKQFNVEVIVGRRVLGTGRGRNKKDAEQAAARDALAQAEGGVPAEEPKRPSRGGESAAAVSAPPPLRRIEPEPDEEFDDEPETLGTPERGAVASETADDREGRRRGRRGGRGRRTRRDEAPPAPSTDAVARGPAGASGTARPASAPAYRTAPPPVDPATQPHGLSRPPLDVPVDRSSIEEDADEIGRPENLIEDGGAAFSPSDRFIGGRTVERVGRPSREDTPRRSAEPERVRPPAFGSLSEEQYDEDDVVERAPEQVKARERVSEPVRETIAQRPVIAPAAPVESRKEAWTEPAHNEDDDIEPQPEVKLAPPVRVEPAPTFGRKRTRR